LLCLNSFHGVYSYDGKGFSNLSRPLHIDHDTVVSMLADKSGNIWLGKNSDVMENGGEGGVWRYDGKSLRLFTTKDGLSHNAVFCIVEDRKHNFWFGTRNTGLCRLEGSTFTDYTDRGRPTQ
jgi:ligand-binding sensor domain-containing protein